MQTTKYIIFRLQIIFTQLHVSALTAISKDTRLDTRVGNTSLHITVIIVTVKPITTHFCLNSKFKKKIYNNVKTFTCNFSYNQNIKTRETQPHTN